MVRHFDFFADRVRQTERIFFFGNVMHGDQEFAAADPGDEVSFANEPSESLRDVYQEFVAYGVAQVVVHGFEAVEIEEEDRELRVSSLGAGERGLQMLHEPVAVGQLGQRVVSREETVALLGLCQVLENAMAFDRMHQGS